MNATVPHLLRQSAIAFVSLGLPLLCLTTTPAGAEPMVMLDASRVRLLDGPFRQRQELHRGGYVGSLEVDRLLFPYRATAGMRQPSGVAGGYGG